MRLRLKRELFLYSWPINHHPSLLIVNSAVKKTALSSFVHDSCKFGRISAFSLFHELYHTPSQQSFSTGVNLSKICWEASSSDVLLRKLESTLKDCHVDEAWDTFNDFKGLYGFPPNTLVTRLFNVLSYSSDPKSLKKACDLVFQIQKEKSDLLCVENLTRLSLSLARARMPVPASRILRLMLEKENLPTINVLLLIFLHMVKTDIGTYLASNYLIDICDWFQHLRARKSECTALMKPDTMIFNLVLDACVRCGLSFKGQQIIELMARAGVVADAHSIVIISQVHEMNGLRDEVKKFKHHIDRVSLPFLNHYRQFYDIFLSLHFMFDDVDAAAEFVLDICRPRFSIKDDQNGFHSPLFVSIGSQHLRDGLKIQILPKMLQRDTVLGVQDKEELVSFTGKKLVLSNKALAKFIYRYKRDAKIDEMSKFLLSIEGFGSTRDVCLCSDVVDACINLGWLESAHDLLDDLEATGNSLGFTAYMSLLTAYLKQNMFIEAKALLRQMRRIGLLKNLSDETVFSKCLAEGVDNCHLVSPFTRNLDLVECLLHELKQHEKEIPCTVYKLNSSIYFFCKAKMIEDALKTYRRMQEMKMQPTIQTFAFLVDGYSSLGKYREITILWGDIKRNMGDGNLAVSRDLYEILLLNFLRGGYFERVMEVIQHMGEQNMYLDKWFYRKEFLKLHKNLYRKMKASDARNEAQSKRLEYVQAFRKWAGID